EAFDNGEWPRLSPEERMAAVQKFSEVYAAHIPDMAAVITEEMGSPITFSNLAQSPAPWMMLNAFLQVAAEYPWEERRQGVLGGEIIVRHEAVGVVGAIVPWNVPQFVTMSKLAPALLAGCTIVLKPSPETPVEGRKFASLMTNGPAWVPQTRVLASRARYDEVVGALAEMVGGLKVGDPHDPATEVGPLVAQRQQERVEKYIAVGQEEGAKVVV